MLLSVAKILVVDDETALCGMFANWLRPNCGRVRTACNGQEALAAILQEPIDILITDVRMPVMDGVALVRRLAELNLQVPCIIFVSAFADVDAREMYHLGVETFLAKPFRLEDLDAAVARAIADLPTLWVEPMKIAPRHVVRFELDGKSGACEEGLRVDAEEERESFRLGRGGFSARSPEPLGLGKIAFHCCFDKDRPELVGQGWVRWRSRMDQAVGIEFAYLESAGRDWVVEYLGKENPRCFIPAM